MIFNFESGLRIAVRTASQVDELIDQLPDNDSSFFILEAPSGHFLQAAELRGGFVVERQQGGLDKHFRASHAETGADVFSTDDVRRISRAFIEGAPHVHGVNWESVDFAIESSPPQTLEEFKAVYGDTFYAKSLWFNEFLSRLQLRVILLLAPFVFAYLAYLIVRDLFFRS